MYFTSYVLSVDFIELIVTRFEKQLPHTAYKHPDYIIICILGKKADAICHDSVASY